MIYQIFVGRWASASLRHHPGRVFSQLKKHDWSYVASLGVTSVYLMGVFDNRGPIIVQEEEGRKLASTDDRLPSVFAISDHRQVHPLLGTQTDLRQLIDHIHSFGLQVILDLVPNHRALSHIWGHTHPDFFYVDDQGKPVAEFSGDVIKLNYNNPEVIAQMLQTITFIKDLGADGIRCDMAHLIPDFFWQQAIAQIKQQTPTFTFIGEIYSSSVFNLDIYERFSELGFDYLYHGELFHNLDQLLAQELPLEDFANHLNYILSQPYKVNLVNYFANHDDVLPHLATYLEACLGLMVFLPGEFLVFNGVLEGLQQRLGHHYYDEISKVMASKHQLTPELATLLRFKQTSKLVVERFASYQQLLVAIGSIGPRDYAIMLNVSQQNQSLPSVISAPGLIHGLQAQESLPPGHCDIFELEPSQALEIK